MGAAMRVITDHDHDHLLLLRNEKRGEIMVMKSCALCENEIDLDIDK
jgi:hypothetical protein